MLRKRERENEGIVVVWVRVYGGGGACEAVSQHISNELGDMMWWRRRSNGCIKYGRPIFPLQSLISSFFHVFI